MFSPRRRNPKARPEWMVSFADMITILMSFFVVMFSIASGDSKDGKEDSQEVAIQSLAYRFGPQWKPFMSWSLMPGNSNLPGEGKGMGTSAPVPAVGDPGGTMQIKKKKKPFIKVDGKGDTVAIGKMLNFDDASAKLSPGQDEIVDQIVYGLRGVPQEVEIVAWASDRPLPAGSSYRDRWELGYTRCRAVAALLTAHNIESARLRLSVIPSSDTAGNSKVDSEENTAVRVYMGETQPAGK